jgi:tRNA(fMet)-specific endonuclease VapC
LAQIDAFVRLLHIVPLSDASLRRFGELKTRLIRTNKHIGDFDLLIACVALTEGLTLVTNNTHHYERVAGLKAENWLVV